MVLLRGGADWGRGRFYFPACQDSTSHPETELTLLVLGAQHSTLRITPTFMLNRSSESFCSFGNEEVLQSRSRKRN